MKKSLLTMIFSVLVSFVWIHMAQAQLINYDRRGRTPGQINTNATRRTTTATSSTSSYAAPAAVAAAPRWQVVAPEAQSRLEKQYDFNRDGKLQESEVRQYLRYVIRQVERRGEYEIKSDFLKIYDKDGDGSISKIELTELRKDVLN